MQQEQKVITVTIPAETLTELQELGIDPANEIAKALPFPVLIEVDG